MPCLPVPIGNFREKLTRERAIILARISKATPMLIDHIKRFVPREYVVVRGLATEQGQAVIRICGTLIFAAYMMVAPGSPKNSALFSIALEILAVQAVFAVIVLYSVFRWVAHSPVRLGMTVAIDQIILGILLLRTGELGAPLGVIPVALIFGSAIRYGRLYGLGSWLTAMAFLVLSTFDAFKTPGQADVSSSVAIAITILPIYLFRLIDPVAVAGRIDYLTRLKNRQVFDELNKELCIRAAGSKLGGAVVILDLDGFKQINDKQGHHAGDEILILVAQWMFLELLPFGTPCRTGGDEFGLVIHDLKNDVALENALRRVLVHLTEAGHAFNSPLGASIGIYYVDAGASLTPRYTNTAADSLMFQAKTLGKGTIQTSKGRTFSDKGKVQTDDDPLPRRQIVTL